MDAEQPVEYPCRQDGCRQHRAPILDSNVCHQLDQRSIHIFHHISRADGYLRIFQFVRYLCKAWNSICAVFHIIRQTCCLCFAAVPCQSCHPDYQLGVLQTTVCRMQILFLHRQEFVEKDVRIHRLGILGKCCRSVKRSGNDSSSQHLLWHISQCGSGSGESGECDREQVCEQLHDSRQSADNQVVCLWRL